MFSAADFANRVLEREHWARAKLAGHAGRTVCVRIGRANKTFAVDADGRLLESESSPDLRLTIPPIWLPTLLAQPERWGECVAAEGDAAFAATLRELALTLPWFVEHLCAKAFGPVAGQTIADLGRRLLTLPGYAVERFADSITRYVGNEAQFAVSAAEARVVTAEISAFSARVDALALRVDGLADSAKSTAPGPPPPQPSAKIKRSPR